MKILFVLYLFITLALFILVADMNQVVADGSCLALNNGGTTTRQVCITPIPSNTPAEQQQPQQSNSSQKVYPLSSNTKTTPNTGSDDWTLPILFLLIVLGLLLRSKSNKPLHS